MGKILEQIIYNRLEEYIEKTRGLLDIQFGFRGVELHWMPFLR